MSYRETDAGIPPKVCDVTDAVELQLLNGVVSEIAVPCNYVLPPLEGETEDRIIPIHLTAEGYGDPVVAFAGAPAGLSATAWIDETDDHIVRIVLSAKCPAAVTKDVTCQISVLTARDTVDRGLRTDAVIRGTVVVKAAPFSEGETPQLPSSFSAEMRAFYTAMLGYGVMDDFVGTVVQGELTITAGSAFVDGYFFRVTTPVTIDLSAYSGGQELVVRYTAATNSFSLALIPFAAVITKNSSVFEISIAALGQLPGGEYSQPVFAYEKTGSPTDPVGSFTGFAHNHIPMTHLRCDGSIVYREIFPRLFEVIGSDWNNVGDVLPYGFRLPDFRARIPAGYKEGDVDFGGLYGGERAHVLLSSEIPSHDHHVLLAADGSVIGGNVLAASSGTQTLRIQAGGSLGGVGGEGAGRSGAWPNGSTVGTPPAAHSNIPPIATQVICIRA